MGFYRGDEDAVDLSSFPVGAPYNRCKEWHNFVVNQRDDVRWRLGQIAQHNKYGYQVSELIRVFIYDATCV